MKLFKLLSFAVLLILASSTLLALPNYFYGNIAIKTDGTLVTSQNIQVRITILDGVNTLYQELFNSVATDAFGAFTVNVGTGTLLSGTWPAGDATATMKTKAEINYGSGWVSLGSKSTMQIILASTTGFSGDPSEIDVPNGEIIIGNASNVGDTHPITGDATMTNTGVLTIANNAVTSAKILDGTIVNADVNAAAGIVYTKLDMTGWTGVNSITTVGTITTGTWNGTSIADAYVDNNLTINGGTVDNTPIGATTQSSGAFTTLNALSTSNFVGQATFGNISNTGSFRLSDGDGTNPNYITVTSPAITADYTLTLPVDDGTANQFLKTDGNGNLSWGTVNVTLQDAYDGGATITTTSGDGDIIINGTQKLYVQANDGLLISNNQGAGSVALLRVQNLNNAFNNAIATFSATGSARAASFMANNTAYTTKIENQGTGSALYATNTGNGSAVYIDNQGNSGLAIEVENNGGAVKLSYESLTVSSSAAIISDNVSVVYITGDNDTSVDNITLPAGTNGQFLYVIYVSTGDNASIGGYTTNGDAQLTFVYANGGWVRVSTVD